MKIDENTQVMARFHHSFNNRGMNIYNPYFKATNTNAIYVLFQNKNPEPLIEGMKKLNMAGAIPAGFETNPKLPSLMDDLDIVAKKANRVAVIRQRNGKAIGFYQGGYGLLESIRRLTSIKNKEIVILGAGTVVRGLLAQLEADKEKPKAIKVYNRTLSKAKSLTKKFPMITQVGSIKDMEKTSGDIFANATFLGTPWNQGEDYLFSQNFIDRFKYIADVAFIPLEPPLIKLAKKLKKKYSPGWKMFLYQGKMCLEKVLDLKVNEKILGEKIYKDFKENWMKIED